MPSETDFFSIPQVISLLEQGSPEPFVKWENNWVMIDAECCMIVLERTDTEHLLFAAEVLKNLDTHIRRAQPWLRHFNVKQDRRNPDGLDAGFEISGIYIGTYETGGPNRPKNDGFTITFRTVNPYPCDFTVKYHQNMQPFAVEEQVE